MHSDIGLFRVQTFLVLFLSEQHRGMQSTAKRIPRDKYSQFEFVVGCELIKKMIRNKTINFSI